MGFTSYSRTHQGQVRQLNEDSVHIERRNMQQGGELFVVADGMGGHQSGEVASQQAIKTIKEVYYQQVSSNNPPLALKKAIQEANRTIYERGQQENRSGMGTTVVAAVRLNNVLHYAHVGDSRLYLVRNDQITQLTYDHSLVAEQVAAGILSPEEAENHPHRNVISRAVGTSAQVLVDLATQPLNLQDGDTLILCSDGLTEHVKPDYIRHLIQGQMPEKAADALINAANAGGGSDNISVIVLQAGKPRAAAATTVRRAASAVMAAPPQNRTQTGVHQSPLKPPGPEKKKGGFALPALGVLALLLLLVIVGGGTWLLTNRGTSEVDTATSITAPTSEAASSEPAQAESTATASDQAAANDGGSSEAEGAAEGAVPVETVTEGESDSTPASESTIVPTPTQEATSTVPAGAPTSTRRPTYTPAPTETPVPPTATALPATATATQTTSRAPASPAVVASATPEQAIAVSVPDATNTPELAPPTNTQAPLPTNTPIPALPTNTPLPLPTETASPAAELEAAAESQPPATQVPVATQALAPTLPAAASPTVAIPTVTPQPTATTAPPTVAIPPTEPPPLPTFTPIPTSPPLPTNTPVPQAPVNYSLGPNALEPAEGDTINSESVTFKWAWNGETLANGQQFRVMGFRDGEWLILNTAPSTQAQVWMPGFGNFETSWQWYVVVIDSGGNEISPTSAKLNFGISLSDGGGDDDKKPPTQK